MNNLKYCIILAAQGQELGLLDKVRLYCKFNTFGRENFNVRIEFISDKYDMYIGKKFAHHMSKCGLWDNKDYEVEFEINSDYDKWGNSISLAESEYVVKCGTFYEYKLASSIIKDALHFYDVKCQIDEYDYYTAPYTDEELKTIKLNETLEKEINKILKLSKRAEIYVHDLIYGRYLRRELKDKKSIEEILGHPEISKAIAEINIYKTKIQKYNCI